MSRNNRHGRGHRNWNSQNGQKNANIQSAGPAQIPAAVFHRTVYESSEDMQKRDVAIRDLKTRKIICPKCGQPITDLTNALADKTTGQPVHFDCVLEELKKTETIGQNERLTYIGQGRFAILHVDNPREMKQFTIVKIIDWESHEKKYDWRDEMSNLYSQIF